MKKFLVFMSLVFVCGIASAETINVNWVVDGDTYAQTSCETGGNFTLPTTPTKYGYHFVGWQQDGSIGYWEQSGTPTPDNPIEPIFRQFGNTVLRCLTFFCKYREGGSCYQEVLSFHKTQDTSLPISQSLHLIRKNLLFARLVQEGHQHLLW